MAQLDYTRLKRKCLDITGMMETSKQYPLYYQEIAGNFDGAGLSYGVVQFNFGSETLQPILNNLITNSPDVVKIAFEFGTDPQYYNTLVTVITTYTKAQQITWGDSISNPSNKHEVIEPWNTYFENLGATTECQNEQAEALNSYYSSALTWYNEYKDYSPATYGSRRLFGLLFDIAIQNGSISAATRDEIIEDFLLIDTNGKTQEEIEQEKMIIIANRRANASTEQWSYDVRNRKLCWARGEDEVHGIYIVCKDYEVTMEDAFPATPATFPKQANKLRDDTVTGNWYFESDPQVRDGKVLSEGDRIHHLPTDVTGIWTLKNGILLNQSYIAKAGNNDNFVQYVRVARIKHKANYGRAILSAELVHSGTYIKTGTMKIISYNNPAQTIHSKSRFYLMSDGVDLDNFVAGDILYQQWLPSGSYSYLDYSYIDIWVKLSNYSQLAMDVVSAHVENTTEIELNPAVKMPLVTNIPVVTTVGYIDTYEVTAQSAVNFDIKTYTLV